MTQRQAWNVAGTIRENILLGSVGAVDSAAYEQVLDCCALREDLAQWPAGDETAIGERGLSLSGGQAARVTRA